MSELRIWVAMQLARDLEACRALLRGEPVDPSRLDPAGLAWATERRLVSLDTRGIDLFGQRLDVLRNAELAASYPEAIAA
jgi:hypothetical protein